MPKSSDVHIAVKKRACDDLKVLLKFPTNKKNLLTYDERGYTPLLIAVKEHYEDVVKVLLEYGADPNQCNKDRVTPLHIALRDGEEEIVNLLIKAGANFLLSDNIGATPLHLAVERGRFDLFEKFFDSQKFNYQKSIVDVKDHEGRTIFHYAAQFRNPDDPTNPHLKIMKKLCALGLPVDERNQYGYTPLHFACRNQHIAMVCHLIENGADYGLETDNGEDPLAIAGSNKALCDYIQQQLTEKPKGKWTLITDNAERSVAIEAMRLLRHKQSEHIEEAQAIYLTALRKANVRDDCLAQVFYMNAIGHCHLWRALCQDFWTKENKSDSQSAAHKDDVNAFLDPHVMHGYCKHFVNAAIYFNAAYQLWKSVDVSHTSVNPLQVEISLKCSVGLVDLHFAQQMERRHLISYQPDRKTVPELPKFELQKDLKSMRNTLVDQLASIDSNSTHICFQTVKQAYYVLWGKLIEQTQALIGGPPSQDYATLVLGEYALGNVFPYERLKWAVLIKHASSKKEALKKYFYAFSWMLSIKAVQLGETPCCVLQGGESPTIAGIHVHPSENPQGIPGVYELLGTPNELAYLQTRYQDSVMQRLLQDLQHVRLLAGDQSLFEEYKKSLKRELANTYPHPYYTGQANAKQKTLNWRLLKIQGLYQITQALDDFDKTINEKGLAKFSTTFYKPLIDALWGFLRLKSTKFRYDTTLIDQLDGFFGHDLIHVKAFKLLKESIQQLQYLRLKIQSKNQDGLELIQFLDGSTGIAANNVYHIEQTDFRSFKTIYESFSPIIATLKQIVMGSHSTLGLFSYTDHVSADIILHSILQTYSKAIDEAKEQIANSKKTQMLATRLYLSRLCDQTNEFTQAITVLEELMNSKSFKKLGRLKQAEVYFRVSVAYSSKKNYTNAQKMAKQGLALLAEKGVGAKHPLRLVLLRYTYVAPQVGVARIQTSQDSVNSPAPSPILSPRNKPSIAHRVSDNIVSVSSFSRPRHQHSRQLWDKIPTNPFVLRTLIGINEHNERLSNLEGRVDTVDGLLKELGSRVSQLEDTTAQIEQQIKLISEDEFIAMIDKLETTDQRWLNDLSSIKPPKTPSSTTHYFELYLRKTINEQFLKCSLIAQGLVNRKEGKLETALALAKDLIGFIPFTMFPAITSMIMHAGLALYDRYETSRIKRLVDVSDAIDGLPLMVAAVSKRYTQIYEKQIQKFDQKNMEIFAKGIMKFMCHSMVKMKLHKRVKKAHGLEKSDHTEHYPVLETLSVCAMMPGMRLGGGRLNPLRKKSKLTTIDGKSKWSVEGLLQYSGIEVIHLGSRELYSHGNMKYNHVNRYDFRTMQSTEHHIFCRLLKHLPKADYQLHYQWVLQNTIVSDIGIENKVAAAFSYEHATSNVSYVTAQNVQLLTTTRSIPTATEWQPGVFKQSQIEHKQTVESLPESRKPLLTSDHTSAHDVVSVQSSIESTTTESPLDIQIKHLEERWLLLESERILLQRDRELMNTSQALCDYANNALTDERYQSADFRP